MARAGLAALLAREPGCSIIGQTGEADLSPASEVHRPEVVIWDMGWDPTTAMEHLADLAEVMPPVVALLPRTRCMQPASGLLAHAASC